MFLFPKQTKWFTEGLALYLETYLWIDAETLRLGDPNHYAYRAYRAVRSINVEDMLAWKSSDQREMQLAGLDGMSWAFVYYARNQEAKTFAQFLASTAELGADAAFEVHFGGRYDQLDLPWSAARADSASAGSCGFTSFFSMLRSTSSETLIFFFGGV